MKGQRCATATSAGAVLSLVAAAAPLPSHAQLLEELVVTAQKREQNAQDVGIAVTAFGGEQLDKLGYSNSLDIIAQTPGVSAAVYHPTLANVSIRGVSQNDFADQLEAPVAIYVDDAYVTSMGLASVQMFDVERVEILRGPQGTLFGRNATGGLIHYISRRPSSRPEGYAELSVGDIGMVKAEGAIGGPLGDSWSGRLSFFSHNDDGYLKNRLGDDVVDNGVWAVRGQLLKHMQNGAELLFKAHYAKDDTNGNSYTHRATYSNPSTWLGPLGDAYPQDGLTRFVPADVDVYGTCPGCDLFGYKDQDGDPHEESLGSAGFQNPEGNAPFFKREAAGASVRLTYPLGDLTLHSVTDFLHMNKDYREDSDGTPYFGALFTTNTDVDQFSQELRLEGAWGPHTWIAGVYYLGFQTDQRAHAPSTLSFGTTEDTVVAFSYTTQARIDSESMAVFGHAQWQLPADLSLITALRFTHDSREIEDHRNYDAFGVFAPSPSFNDVFPDQAKQTWDNVSAKLQLDWKPTDDLLVYAGYTRGHKAGNFSLPLAAFLDPTTTTLSLMPHDQEVLNSYEGGFKWSFASDRGRLNLSVFHYDYQDYQAAFFVDVSQIIDNLDATVDGAELELAINPVAGLDVLLGVSLIDGKAKDVVRTAFLAPSDQDLPVSPDFTVNGLVRYEWPAFGGSLAVQADFKYVDKFCFTLVCNPVEEEGSYVVGDARITYTSPDERWSIAAFVNNVSDAEYRTYALTLEAIATSMTQAYAPPRWAGMTFRYNW